MQNMVFSNGQAARADAYGTMSATEFPTVGSMLELTPGNDASSMPWKSMLQSYDTFRLGPSYQSESLVKPAPMQDTPASNHKAVTPELFISNLTHSPPGSNSQPPESIDERIEAALESLESLGFSNFDCFADAYYNGNFEESSHLAAEQGISRKRRLPRLLSGILDAAQSWDPWEQRGLSEEVLRAAESLLVAEGKNIDEKSLEASMKNIAGLIQTSDGAGTQQHNQDWSQHVATMKKMFQNEVCALNSQQVNLRC